MASKKPDESLEAVVARIDERVANIHEVIPMVRRHDTELLVAKVLFGVGLCGLAIKFPMIAEAIGNILK